MNSAPKKPEPGSNGGSLTSWMIEAGWADTWAPLPRKVTPEGHQPSPITIHDYELTAEDLQLFHEKGYWVRLPLIIIVEQ